MTKTTANPTDWEERSAPVCWTRRALKENHVMYYTIFATVLGLGVFTTSFIGIRATTNANWRSL